MGRIIAVTNLKGGIGKTTTVVNVGAGLALKGARVLLVDVDAQGNLAPALGVQPRRTIYEVLIDNVDPTKCITSARHNLDLIAADDSLLGAQNDIARRSDWSRVLEKALRPLKNDYDFILVDAPGSLTVLSVNALSASNDLLVPTTVEHLSVKGLSLLFKQVIRIKNSASSIRIIVPTMFDTRMRHSVEMLKQLQETYGALIAPPIRVNVRLPESTSQGRTIYEHDRRSRGALDYAHLVDRLSDMWGFHPPSSSRPRATPRVSPAPQPVSSQNGTYHTASPARPEPEHHKPFSPHPPAHVPRPAAQPEAPDNDQPAPQPVVTGEGNMSQRVCPHCGHLLRRTTVAGYRVAFCDHCKYKQQELVSRSRS
jgi:chromosome partitioning protein